MEWGRMAARPTDSVLMPISAAIATGLAFVARQQRPDGGFDGLASTDPDDFTTARLHPTVFFTALIARCCAGLPSAAAIGQRAANYLTRHASTDFSWNYWQRDDDGAAMRRYPDDLDDTACAALALWHFRPDKLDGAALAQLGRHLIAAETTPGGPYQTWIVPLGGPASWHDVDVAVNANIAALLRALGVRPPGLSDYLLHALRSGQLASGYYLGDLPTLYFISAGADPLYDQALRGQIQPELGLPAAGRSSLMNALLLSAARRCAAPLIDMNEIVDSLLDSQLADGSWPASALYVEPPYKGQPQYAGSAALTTALVCEALQLCQADRPVVIPRRSRQYQAGYQLARDFTLTIDGAELRQLYSRALLKLYRQDGDSQISRLAAGLAEDCGLDGQSGLLLHASVASINGWLAYSLYDDILDGDSGSGSLPAANLALRQTVEHFQLTLPARATFRRLVQADLMLVDAANAWEFRRARAQVAGRIVSISHLPDYGDLSQLAERSWGHQLAPTAVLLHAGIKLDGRQFRAWRCYFKHFLIARQLHDDAHDWADDLCRGRLTAVVVLLVADRGLPIKLDVKRDMAALRQQFWQRTIETVCCMITDHLDQAEAALQECAVIKDKRRLQALLDTLRQAAGAARQGRQQVIDFMDNFSEPAEIHRPSPAGRPERTG